MLKPPSRPPASPERPGGGPAGLLARARSALTLLVREALKFGVVGGVAFVVDVGSYNLLVHVGSWSLLAEHPLTAGILSALLATIVAWLGNRYWTFRHRRRSDLRREAVLFFAMNVIGMGIAVGCLAVSRYLLHLDGALADNIAKNGIGLVLGMVFRFLAYRYVVFRGSNGAEEPDPATADVTAAQAPEPDPVTAAQAPEPVPTSVDVRPLELPDAVVARPDPAVLTPRA